MNPQELKSILSHGLLSFPVTDFNARVISTRRVTSSAWNGWPYGASALFAAGGTGEFFSLAVAGYSQSVKTPWLPARPACRSWPGVGGAAARQAKMRPRGRTPQQSFLLLPHYLTEASLGTGLPPVEAVCKSVRIGVVVYNHASAA